MWLSKCLDHSLYTSWQNKQWIRKNTWYLKSPINSYQIERHLSCRVNRICSLLPSFCTGWLTLHLTENLWSMVRSQGNANASALYLAILNGIHIAEHHVVPNMYEIFICLFYLISFFLNGGQELHWPQGLDWMCLLAHVQMEGAASAICFPYDMVNNPHLPKRNWESAEIQPGVAGSSSGNTKCLHVTSREQSACVLGI